MSEPLLSEAVRAPSHRRLALRRFLRAPAGMVGGALTAVVVVVAVLADVVAPGDPLRSSGPALQ